MLREQLIVNGIERLARCVDGKRQRHAERLAEYRLDDHAGVALEHGTLDAIDLDGPGGFQQGGAFWAVIGADHRDILGHLASWQIRSKILFLTPIVLFSRLCKMQEFAADTATRTTTENER